tara:strand:+ start:69 stop:278 length:210 start_codon:yes stop_codon:yes gene_type:complete
MDFINKKAIVVAILLSVGVWFATEAFYNRHRKEEAAISAFFIFAVVLHAKPELMGKLNKTDEDANEEEN